VRLRNDQRSVIQTAEPGGTAVGQAVRKILLDPQHDRLDARAELLLYFASRAQNIAEVIEPALERGDIVACDRFTDSTIVYQGAGRGIGAEPILELHKIACRDLWPDITILLDLDLETALARARARTARNEARLEDEDCAFFSRVRDGYLKLAAENPDRIALIDGRGDADQVHQRVWEVVSRHV
jgi:dTMP kinase